MPTVAHVLVYYKPGVILITNSLPREKYKAFSESVKYPSGLADGLNSGLFFLWPGVPLGSGNLGNHLL